MDQALDAKTEFKASLIKQEELLAIMETESLANIYRDFLDFIDCFETTVEMPFKRLNAKVKRMEIATKKYLMNFFDTDLEGNQKLNLEALNSFTPNVMKQMLVREFRIIDMISIIVALFIHEPYVNDKLNLLKLASSSLKKKQTHNESFDLNHSGGKRLETKQFLGMFDWVVQLLYQSSKKNLYNRLYTSQFVRCFMESLCEHDQGVLKLDSTIQVKAVELLLDGLKEYLQSDNLSALVQASDFRIKIFNNMLKQTNYCPVYLNLLTQISRIKAPNFKNRLRTEFVTEYLSQREQMRHTFPAFVVEEWHCLCRLC